MVYLVGIMSLSAADLIHVVSLSQLCAGYILMLLSACTAHMDHCHVDLCGPELLRVDCRSEQFTHSAYCTLRRYDDRLLEECYKCRDAQLVVSRHYASLRVDSWKSALTNLRAIFTGWACEDSESSYRLHRVVTARMKLRGCGVLWQGRAVRAPS
jgi:hypothetical protein